MAAANASARGQRLAILASPLTELTGYALVVDCRGADCGGQRSYAIACYRPCMTVGVVLRQTRCARGCGGGPPIMENGRANTSQGDSAQVELEDAARVARQIGLCAGGSWGS